MSNTNQQDVFAQVAAGVIEDSIKGAWKKVKDFLLMRQPKKQSNMGLHMRSIFETQEPSIARLKR